MRLGHGSLLQIAFISLRLVCSLPDTASEQSCHHAAGVEDVLREPAPAPHGASMLQQRFNKTRQASPSSDHQNREVVSPSRVRKQSRQLSSPSSNANRTLTDVNEYAAWAIKRPSVSRKIQENARRNKLKPRARSTRYAALERKVTDVEEGGVAVVVPGLGSYERAATVELNLRWLKKQGVPFDCWIFVYRTEQELPLNASRFSPCQVVRHRGYWLGHMLAMPLNVTKKPWILHMEESSEAQADMNLTSMLRIMAFNGLGHGAPTFDTAKNPNPYGCKPPCGCCGSSYPILAQQKPNVNPGRFVDFIELHIDVFSRQYFACLQDNIDTSDERILHGWGMDRLLPALCGGAVNGSEVQAGLVGLFDHMTLEKVHHGSYKSGDAAVGMQKFLEKHPNTALTRYATLGQLKAPP